MTIMFFGGLILPLFIKIVFYIQIWYVLKSNEFFINYTLKLAIKSNENVYETTKNEIKLNEISSRNENVKFIKKSIVADLNQQNQTKIIRNEIKLLKSIILIIVMFCFAWFPYAIITLLAQYGSNIEYYITPFTTSLPSLFAKLSSVYNPVIFLFGNKKCRKYLKKKFYF